MKGALGEGLMTRPVPGRRLAVPDRHDYRLCVVPSRRFGTGTAKSANPWLSVTAVAVYFPDAQHDFGADDVKAA